MNSIETNAFSIFFSNRSFLSFFRVSGSHNFSIEFYSIFSFSTNNYYRRTTHKFYHISKENFALMFFIKFFGLLESQLEHFYSNYSQAFFFENINNFTN